MQPILINANKSIATHLIMLHDSQILILQQIYSQTPHVYHINKHNSERYVSVEYQQHSRTRYMIYNALIPALQLTLLQTIINRIDLAF